MKRRRHWTTRLGGAILAILAIVLLIHTTTLTQVNVTTARFMPHFRAGDHLLVFRWAYGWIVPWSTTNEPQRVGKGIPRVGDWVLIYDPTDTTTNAVRLRPQILAQVNNISGDTLTIWLPQVTGGDEQDSLYTTWQISQTTANHLIGRVICISYHTRPTGGIDWTRTFASLPTIK
ncbi:MAG: hypothetical protein Q4A44_02235 [Bacteroidales bacterium]|nr:hypothetical protein [Bacteroidales bacterium]